MPFTDLTLTTLDDKPGHFRVENDVTYWWVDEESLEEFEYVVKAGVETDLASIPRVFRIFFSKVGRSRKPAVFHDDMYRIKWKTRKDCDDMFRQMLLERGMNRFTAWMFHRAVRMFGSLHAGGSW